MATLDDLKAVLRETLETRGVLSQLQARIRAEIFNALEDQEPDRPRLSNENMIVNELIREYLEFNGYQNTLSVFMPETGQPTPAPFEAPFLEQHLHIRPQPSGQHRLPLLYRIVKQLNEGRTHDRADAIKIAPVDIAGPGRAVIPPTVQSDFDPATGAPQALSFSHKG